MYIHEQSNDTLKVKVKAASSITKTKLSPVCPLNTPVSVVFVALGSIMCLVHTIHECWCTWMKEALHHKHSDSASEPGPWINAFDWQNALHKPRALRYAKNTGSFNMMDTLDIIKSWRLLPESGEGETVPSVCHGCVWLLGKWRHALNWSDWLTDELMNCGYCGQLKDKFQFILDVTFGFTTD